MIKNTQFMGRVNVSHMDARRLKDLIDQLVTIALSAATSDGLILFDAGLVIRLEPDTPAEVTPPPAATE